MATVNLGRIGFVNQGTYDAGTAYQVGDVVEYLNSVYACRVSGTGNPLTDANYWTVWVDSDFLAPLASPALTGTPTAPTAVSGTNTTQLATTEFVSLSSSLRRASIPMSKVLSGVLSLSNVIKTLSFDAVTYTGNGGTQNIVTGISSVDFTVASNGSGYWLDRTVNQVKTDAGVVQASGECKVNTSKVHIKPRTSAESNQIVDGIRGIGKVLVTDTTSGDATLASVTAFTNTGFSLNMSGYGVNDSGLAYIAYQTLYTHIKWGVTSQGKFQIEAYNPVTNEGMIYYIGSGGAGHQISHSQGVEIDYIDIKRLTTTASDWISTHISGTHGNINSTAAIVTSNSNSPSFDSLVVTVEASSYTNQVDNEYIMYYKCKSETFTTGTYTGTGVAGNFVETKDVNGVARKPRRVIIKRIDSISSWSVHDSVRTVTSYIRLDESSAEVGYTEPTFQATGFTVSSSSGYYNEAGGQYLYLVEFDTDNTGTTGSYFDKATDTTNLQIADGLVSISSGYDGQGAINKVISKTGTMMPNRGWI